MPPFPVDNTVGALLVSSLIGFAFCGIVMAQAIRYFWNFWNDRWIFKVVVWASLLCTFANMAVWPTWYIDWGLQNAGNPLVMVHVHYAFPVALVLVGLSASISQFFFAWRLKILGGPQTHSWVLPIFIVAMSLVQLLAMLITTAREFEHTLLADLGKIYPAGKIWCGSSISADVAVTGGMLYHLIWKTRHVNFESRITFRRIAIRAVENNIITLFLQAFLTGMLLKGPGFWFTCVDTTMAPAYTFALLLSLNGRNARGLGLSAYAFEASNDKEPTSKGKESDRPTSRISKEGIIVTIHQERKVEVAEGSQVWRQKKTSDSDAPSLSGRFGQSTKGSQEEALEIETA